MATPLTTDPAARHQHREPHSTGADGGPNPLDTDHGSNEPHSGTVGVEGPNIGTDPSTGESHSATVGAEQSPHSTIAGSNANDRSSNEDASPAAARDELPPSSNPLPLVDAGIHLIVKTYNDTEAVWEAAGNRLYSLRNTYQLGEDTDVVMLLRAEHADLDEKRERLGREIGKIVRRTDLWKRYGKHMTGIGELQLARLLGEIGDPYWHEPQKRPRRPLELRAYAGHAPESTGVAPKRRKGVRPERQWSDAAKMRVHLIAAKAVMVGVRPPCLSARHHDEGPWALHAAENCVCSPYRLAYDKSRHATIGTWHGHPCDQCSSKGEAPKGVGSPRKNSHLHTMALRVVGQRILDDLYTVAKQLHEEAELCPT